MPFDLSALTAHQWVTVHSFAVPVEVGVVPVSPAMLDEAGPVLRALIDQAIAPDAPDRDGNTATRLTRHQEQALQAIAIAGIRVIRAVGDEEHGPCRFVLNESGHAPADGVFWVGYLTTADLASVYCHALAYHGRALARARGFRKRSSNGGDDRRDGEEVRDDA